MRTESERGSPEGRQDVRPQTTTRTGSIGAWAEERSHPGGRARLRARIAGLHCSLCTGSIERAVGRIQGVERVAVSLTHEQVLVDY
ncbi:MAG TPA: heavy metal-associated domain-containing protein, partial [Actinomycetota bacterium]|nr:heavy metal-associated domain-containing protein [Actinomycetota bacterium]